jgi:hypothetical protein
MFERKDALPCLAGATLAAVLAACGGSSSGPTGGSNPTPAPTPTPCTQTTLKQEGSGVPSLTLLYDDFSVPDTGRLDVTMDWTFAASQMGFYVVPANSCTLDEFNARSCNFLIRSETMAKPRKISTPNFGPGNYRWMIANFSDADESITLQIILSKGSCPALGGTPGASERTDETRPPLGRALHH